jgi:DNA gyrase/topoisomerase IV subunit A
LSVRDFNADGYLIFATRQGMIKKTTLREYGNLNASGLIAINLMDGDELVSVHHGWDGAHVVLATRSGRRSASLRPTPARWAGRRRACAASNLKRVTWW